MKKFSTLFDASVFASSKCSYWKFSTSDDYYDKISLSEIAKVHDQESIADEDSYYVVADSGAIGFCEDEDTDIDWLFLVRDNLDESLPLTYVAKTVNKFCSNCSRAVKSDARFCTDCGSKLG